MSEIQKHINKGGVKTSEGKAVSKYNAVKHGILRETYSAFEKVDAEQIYNELSADMKPSGRLQEMYVENIASNYIRLIRAAKAESELVMEVLSPNLNRYFPSKEYESQLRPDAMETLARYSKYLTATENRMHRAVSMLKQLKMYE